MKETTKTEIERITGNRHSESHPLQRNSVGMEGFSRMVPLIDELEPEEIKEFLLPLVNSLLVRMRSCFSCYAKGLAFAEYFCSRKCPEKSIDYWQLFQKHFLTHQKHPFGRDYRTEVYKEIIKYCVGKE